MRAISFARGSDRVTAVLAKSGQKWVLTGGSAGRRLELWMGTLQEFMSAAGQGRQGSLAPAGPALHRLQLLLPCRAHPPASSAPALPGAVTANGESVGAYKTVKMAGGSLVLQASAAWAGAGYCAV